jgi:hypothetical protein
MMTAPWLRPFLRKEVRALVPTWAGCALVIWVAGIRHDQALVPPTLLVYGLGSIALGALSMGHEYTYRTIGLLLSQPVDRRQMLAVKLGVLAGALALLTALMWLSIPSDPHVLRWSSWAPYAVPIAMLLALLVAPWLTMVCRSPLAGAVFTGAIPAILLLVGEVAGSSWYGAARPGDIDRFKTVVFWSGIVGTSVVCGLSTWWAFAHLESLDGRGAAIGTPAWLQLPTTDRPARRHHPLWALVKKELRLQQLTFVVVGIYALGLAAFLLLSRHDPGLRPDTVILVTMLYLALVAILIGALASAEERQLGTVEWQMLLPVPRWMQWAVKSGVALTLSMTLWLAAFSVLAQSSLFGNVAFSVRGPWLQITTFILLLTTGSLYVSSLSTSGVKALAASLPVSVAVSLVGSTAMSLIRSSVFNVMRARADLSRISIESYQAVVNTTAFAVGVVFALVLLRFAFVNHRSPERAVKRVALQVTALAAFAVVCLVTMAMVVYYPASRAH